jgi:hypothetical protein
MLPFLAPFAFVVFVDLPAIVVSLWGRLWGACGPRCLSASCCSTSRHASGKSLRPTQRMGRIVIGNVQTGRTVSRTHT